MAPCAVVERLEGKQQCSRAPVGEHAEVQAQDAECGCHGQQEVNEKRPKPATAHHTITTTRCLDNIRSSILVRGRSIRSMARSCRQPRGPLPQTDSHFRHFGGPFFIKVLYMRPQAAARSAHVPNHCLKRAGSSNHPPSQADHQSEVEEDTQNRHVVRANRASSQVTKRFLRK